jgi:hypothetical protein
MKDKKNTKRIIIITPKTKTMMFLIKVMIDFFIYNKEILENMKRYYGIDSDNGLVKYIDMLIEITM